jgi:hypothetical protein
MNSSEWKLLYKFKWANSVMKKGKFMGKAEQKLRGTTQAEYP